MQKYIQNLLYSYLITWKTSIFDELERVVEREIYVVTVRRYAEQCTGRIYKIDGVHYHGSEDVFRNATKKLFEEVIPLSDSSSWDTSFYKKVESYLNSGKPRQQLDEIRTVLQQLYSTLKDIFSIQDFLLKVGDRRPSETN